MLKQTKYNHDLQDWSNQLASDIWAYVIATGVELNDTTAPEAPQVIHLHHLINGYAKNPGHFLPNSNLIVLNMKHGTAEASVKHSIAHELAHWLQGRLASYKPVSRSDQHHKVPSWREAIKIISDYLTGEEHPIELFRSTKSTRVDGEIVKVQREGSLTEKQVHGWPNSMPTIKKALSAR